MHFLQKEDFSHAILYMQIQSEVDTGVTKVVKYEKYQTYNRTTWKLSHKRVERSIKFILELSRFGENFSSFLPAVKSCGSKKGRCCYLEFYIGFI